MCIDPEGCLVCVSFGAYLTELLGWFCWGHLLPGPSLHTPVTHGSQCYSRVLFCSPGTGWGGPGSKNPLSYWEIFLSHTTPILLFCFKISKDVFSPYLVTRRTAVSGFGRKMYAEVLSPL